MNHSSNLNLSWSQENGYEYHAETGGVLSGGAGELDVFRKVDGFRNQVVGTCRNRRFEILDVRKEKHRAEARGFVEKTVVLIPTVGIDLPDFDLLPRREMSGMDFLGITGLDLKLNASASVEERRMVDAFNQNYSLFAGGAFEAMEASIRSADDLVTSVSDMASICKPGVLRFLSTACTGFIEVQNGYLAVQAPEMRMIKGAFSDTILVGRERESLLSVANDLLDVLANASREAPLRGLVVENTFAPARMIGGLVGTAAGFFLGFFVGLLLLFLVGKKLLLLIPVLALVGALLGNFVGKALMRSK